VVERAVILEDGISDITTLDLTDARTYVDFDPRDIWRRFRVERPVYRHPAGARTPGFWAVCRHADVLACYRDDERFTSERGNVLATLLQGHDSAAGKMLAVTDGPRHRAIRKLMLKSFSPRVVAHMRERAIRRTHGLLAAAAERDEVDFALDVTDHVPINTIGDLMDIPDRDRAQLVEWNTRSLAGYGADHDELEEVMARNEILMYFSDLARHRRQYPGDDVITALATGMVDGEPLSEDEIVFNCYSLIFGGDESSRMASIGAVIALVDHPDQWRALREGTVGIDTAVDEVLRWTTPAMHFGRRALVDVPLRDSVIKAGDVVTLWNASANFDEEAFDHPEAFDLARTPNRHVTFGYGPHFCLGAFLGRAHVEGLLTGLRETVSAIEQRGPGRRLYSNFVYGYTSLPVSLTPA
jgi:cytochrome P450